MTYSKVLKLIYCWPEKTNWLLLFSLLWANAERDWAKEYQQLPIPLDIDKFQRKAITIEDVVGKPFSMWSCLKIYDPGN
jgi:hypothetical protein